MFRTVLIVVASLLAGGTAVFTRQIPVAVNMKGLAQIAAGLGFFFVLFFAAVRLIDEYFWWSIPAVGFVCVIYYGVRKVDDIGRLIRRERPGSWLTDTASSMPVSGAPMTAEELQVALAAYDVGQERYLEPAQRRFLDEFFIADEADLGPSELELERLDDFIFTSRHGYLVHDHNPDRAPCDVMTITPGMSVADLIDAAKAHECVKETA
jgi:hypothetical protein